MRNHCVALLTLGVSLVLASPVQAQDSYVHLYIAHVKPEKRAEFDAVSKRIAEINRKNHGQNFLVYEEVFGDQNAIHYVGIPTKLEEMETTYDAFASAMIKEVGAAGMTKLIQEQNATLVSAHGELRRLSGELSANLPKDAAALYKMLGEARWLRTWIVRVRPARGSLYEAELARNKEAQERANPGVPIFVSTNSAGDWTGTFYTTTVAKTLGDFNKPKSMGEARGAGYADFAKMAAEAFLDAKTVIYHVLPELSNPPAEVVAADPAFWRPAPAPKPPARK